MDSQLLPIPYNRIDDVWPRVETMLKLAVRRCNGRYLLEDVRGFLESKDMVLWVSVRNKEVEACAVTEIIQYKRKKMCAVRIVTGKNKYHWVGLEQGIADWAKSIGCDGMEADARKGWVKIFKQYQSPHVKLERFF